MKLATDAKSLQRLLDIVAPALPKRGRLPAIEGILLQTEGDILRATASNLDLTIAAEDGAVVNEDGKILVPGKQIIDLVRALPDGDVDIAVEGTRCVVRYAGGVARLPIMTAAIRGKRRVDYIQTVSLDAAILREMVEAVAPFATTTNVRPILEGVHLDIGSYITATATDGYRIAHVAITDRPTSGLRAKATIPAGILRDAVRGLDGAATLAITDNRARLEANGVTAWVRIIDGQYPDLSPWLTTNCPHRVTAARTALEGAIRRVAPFGEHPDKVQVVALTVDDEGITVSAKSDTGEGEERIPAEVEGGALKVLFRAGYLLDGLRLIGGDTVTLEFGGALAPMRASRDGRTYIAMPMRDAEEARP